LSTETVETPTNPETAAAGQPETGAEQGHEHQHQHGPTFNPEVTRSVEVTIPADEVSRAMRSAVKRYQKQARLPGFRAGKVPESLIRARFADRIRQEVLEAVMPQHFQRAIAESHYRLVSQPQVVDMKMEDDQPLWFKAEFEVMPEFSVEGYPDVKVERPSPAFTDEEFNTEIERVRDSRSTMEPVEEDRPLADGDWAQISFTGELNGENAESAEGGESASPTAQPIEGKDVSVEIGGKDTVQAFSDALRSSRPGQELKFEVTYPGDFGQKRLAGKTVAYKVEVKGIQKRVLPELNDDFAKDLGSYESLEDFRQKLREHLAADKKNRLLADTRNRLIDALSTKFQFPIPESLVQSQIDTRLERGLRALAAQGMRTEDMRNLDFDRLREAQRESATAEVKGTLVLERIADVENIQVSDEEVERELQVISLQTREPLETLRDRLSREGSLARIREQLRREKTGSLLVERLT
jgi:trigger factor